MSVYVQHSKTAVYVHNSDMFITLTQLYMFINVTCQCMFNTLTQLYMFTTLTCLSL